MPVKCIEDIESEHLCRLYYGAVRILDKRLPPVESKILVKELEAVRYGKERADGDRWHDIRYSYLPQCLPLGCAVDSGGFQHILRDSLQSGYVNYHHIAYLLPADQNDQPPESVGRVHKYRRAEARKNTVEYHRPDISENDTADEVWHKENSSEDVAAPDLLCKSICHGKGKDIYQYKRRHGKQGRIAERMAEACVIERFPVIGKP